MREIKLTQDKVALVDDADFEWISQYHWYAHSDKYNFYAYGHPPRNGKKQTVIFMHRIILNAPKGMEIDHRDGNGLNNQRSNLRICTRTQNAKNRKPQAGISKLKGIDWHGYSKKWRARINVDGKSRHLGCFESEEMAAMTYDNAARELHREFARTNF